MNPEAQKDILEFINEVVTLCEKVDNKIHMLDKEKRKLAILHHLVGVYRRASDVEPSCIKDVFGSDIDTSAKPTTLSQSSYGTTGSAAGSSQTTATTSYSTSGYYGNGWNKQISADSDTDGSDFSDDESVIEESDTRNMQLRALKTIIKRTPFELAQIAREGWVDVVSEDEESDEELDDSNDPPADNSTAIIVHQGNPPNYKPTTDEDLFDSNEYISYGC